MQVLNTAKHKPVKCRQRFVLPNHPSGSRYCPNCKHYAIVESDGSCQCCLSIIPNKKQFTKLRVFDKILRSCSNPIDEWIADPCNPDLEFGWSIRIGIINYFVPVRYLAEYRELPNLESEDKEERFLNNVKKECTVLGRYIHAIK